MLAAALGHHRRALMPLTEDVAVVQGCVKRSHAWQQQGWRGVGGGSETTGSASSQRFWLGEVATPPVQLPACFLSPPLPRSCAAPLTSKRAAAKGDALRVHSGVELGSHQRHDLSHQPGQVALAAAARPAGGAEMRGEVRARWHVRHARAGGDSAEVSLCRSPQAPGSPAMPVHTHQRSASPRKPPTPVPAIRKQRHAAELPLMPHARGSGSARPGHAPGTSQRAQPAGGRPPAQIAPGLYGSRLRDLMAPAASTAATTNGGTVPCSMSPAAQ